MKKSFVVLLAVMISVAAGAGIYLFMSNPSAVANRINGISQLTPKTDRVDNSPVQNAVNFVAASKSVTPAVVHIKTTYSGSASATSLS